MRSVLWLGRVAVLALVLTMTLAGGAPSNSEGAVPRKVFRVNWAGSRQVTGGVVRFRVTRIVVGSRAWTITARIENRSTRSLRISRAQPPSFRDCRTGLISFHREDTAYGASYGSRQYLATGFRPSLPGRLAAGATWTGTFRGTTRLPRKTLIYVCVGYFPPQNGIAGFGWVSDQAFRL